MRAYQKLLLAAAGLISVGSVSIAVAQGGIVADAGAASRIQWWRDAKFGLFIHWGLYSVPGRGEWVQWDEQIPVNEYARLGTQFNPDKFDPDAWAAAAKSAGMRYTVLTSRHHDGFALFDDPASDFTALHTPAHRDFVKSYIEAMRGAGLRVGLYYSPLDWRFPGFFFPDLYRSSAIEMREQYHRQLNELAKNYGKLDVLWFDGGGVDWLGFNGVQFKNGWHGRSEGQHYSGDFTWEDDQALADLRRLQPSIITNNRTDAPGDFISREGDKALGDFDSVHPWELCITIGGSWGYQPMAGTKPLKDLLRLLIGAVGRDGNLLLNVGPQPDGQISTENMTRLHEMGEWLNRYGDSIYHTRGGPYLPGDYGVTTYRDETVYVHLLNSASRTVVLPALPSKVTGCSVLHGGNVSCKQGRDTLVITLDGAPDSVDTIVALKLDSPAATIKPIATLVTNAKGD